MESYYDLLGVSKTADDEELKKAYKKQAMKWHPDRNKKNKDKAEERFKRIAEAYDVLSDKDKRAVYDRYGEEGLKGGVPKGGSDVPMGEAGAGFQFPGGGRSTTYTSFDRDMADQIFRQFFGADMGGMGGGIPGGATSFSFQQTGPGVDSFNMFQGGSPAMGGARTRKPASEYRLSLGLDEIYSGTTKRLKLTRQICVGQTNKHSTSEETIEIKVKPGWKAGTRITFEGKGDEPAPGVPAGDIVFVVDEKPHPFFRREGDNLVHTASISLRAALTGFNLTVPSLDGREIKVSVRDVVSPDTTETIKGEGMPLSKSPGQRGDLIIRFQVEFPKKLTSEQKTQLKNAL